MSRNKTRLHGTDFNIFLNKKFRRKKENFERCSFHCLVPLFSARNNISPARLAKENIDDDLKQNLRIHNGYKTHLLVPEARSTEISYGIINNRCFLIHFSPKHIEAILVFNALDSTERLLFFFKRNRKGNFIIVINITSISLSLSLSLLSSLSLSHIQFI